MAEPLTPNLLQHIDPSAAMNNEDTVRLLMDYCNKISEESIRHERNDTKDKIDSERRDTNDKIQLVIKGINNSIATVADTLTKHMCAQSDRLAGLELQLKRHVDSSHALKASSGCDYCDRTFETNLLLGCGWM